MAIPQSVGKATYTFEWKPGDVVAKVEAAAQATMFDLADQIEPYLHSTLHRWTGEMADMAYAIVVPTSDGWLLMAGSRSDHTFFHEIRYHPQLRVALDLWGPRIGPTLQKHLG